MTVIIVLMRLQTCAQGACPHLPSLAMPLHNTYLHFLMPLFIVNKSAFDSICK